MKEKNKLMVKLIKTYQKNKQLIGVGHCKFYPTCSNYALETYKKFNFLYASILVGIRILRCNWFARRRYYPVKLTKDEKQKIKYLNNIKAYLQDDFVNMLIEITNKDITEQEIYKYIYDYYYLPEKVSTNALINKVYGNKYIVTKEKLTTNIIDNKIDFKEYLKITDELYKEKIINKTYQICEIKQKEYYLTQIDMLNIIDILKYFNITNNILINNYNKDIIYKDYINIYLDNNNYKELIKTIKNNNNLIIHINNLDIFTIIDYISFSINIYDDISNISYFYDINKKA